MDSLMSDSVFDDGDVSDDFAPTVVPIPMAIALASLE